MTTIKLIKHLDFLLKEYIHEATARKILRQEILLQFEKHSFYTYRVSDQVTLILSKDSRIIQPHRRYKNSPFPFLTNVSYFSNSVGSWNKELLEYGITSRLKDGDTATPDVSSRIYLIKLDSISTQGNKYLKRQYKRLESLRRTGNILEYWKQSWLLMSCSKSYRIASLSSWQNTWYKSLSYLELSKILNGLNSILDFSIQSTNIYNIWIESPKSKWRQLSVPSKCWRLYFHMLNMFLTYIYEPHLPSHIYDGFIYNRGCKSWWEKLLWSPLLSKFSWLFELDFSSGFPNLNLHSVRRSLTEDGLLPPPL